jgi:crossover junction endodeoxyribonuclease RusA
VLLVAMKAGIRKPDMRRLRVDIVATMPDRRRRDLDNLLKALLDALQHARVFFDDEQIDALSVRRNGCAKPGGVEVTIEGAA